MNGLVVVDKPEGPTSFDVVARLRKVFGTREIGHCGTLDPLATGVLVVVVGTWTRLVRVLSADDKRYTATIAFGASTTTDDREGDVVATGDPARVSEVAVRAALPRFVGAIRQRPPAFSAVHVGGKRAHERARAGEVVEMAERDVVVHGIELVAFVPGWGGAPGPLAAAAATRAVAEARDEVPGRGGAPEDAGTGDTAHAAPGDVPEDARTGDTAHAAPGDVRPGATDHSGPTPRGVAAATRGPGAPPRAGTTLAILDVRCGKGTYIRSLARDLGEAVGVPAHLHALRRTESGAFTLADAVPLDEVRGLRSGVGDVRGVRLVDVDADAARALRQGKRVPAPAAFDGTALAHAGDELVALVRCEENRLVVERAFPG